MRFSVHPDRLRALLAAGAALTVLAVSPGAAHAASVSEASSKLSYVAAAGEANHVTIAPWGWSLKVTETGTKDGAPIAVTVGPGCWRLSSSSASCGLLISSIDFAGGDGDDYLDAGAVRTPVTASGGPGDDTLSTGSGADTLDGGDGADTLTCGEGVDGGSADALDTVAADCDAVTRPDPPPSDPGSDPGSTDPDPAGPPPANAVPPTIPPQTVGVSASGVATVLVACPPASGGCKGTVAIELPGAANRRHAKAVSAARGKPALRIGSAKFKAAAGSSKSVPVRLSKRGRQRILRGRRTRARITVTTRSAAGTTSVVRQDVTLRPRSGKRRARRR